MKKYFYHVVQYRTNTDWNFAKSVAGVCESSKKGFFPLVRVINETIGYLKAKYSDKPGVVLDSDSVSVINTVEISEDDYLMVNYDNIHGKDSEK